MASLTYRGKEGKYIPSDVDRLIIDAIVVGPGVCMQYFRLKEVVFGNGLKEIGVAAFLHCCNLQRAAMPSSLEVIHRKAFSDCKSLVELHLQEGLCTIGESSFEGCTSLEEVTIPSTVETIPSHAFSSCISLTEVHLQIGLKVIGQHAFESCSSLKEISIPSSVETIEDEALRDCKSLITLTLNEGLHKIARGAFSNCSSLRDVSIPSSVEMVEGCAFQLCTRLVDLDLKKGLKTIGHNAFQYCWNLKCLNVPSSVETIQPSAFAECKSLGEVGLSEGLKNIGDQAFEKCVALRTMKIPSTVETIGRRAFNRCFSLRDVHLSTTRLGFLESFIFKNCRCLRAISLAPSIQTICWNAFRGCSSLVSVEFSCDAPLEISSSGSFKNCKSLANISISPCHTLGDNPFDGCKRLERKQSSTGIGNITMSRFQEYPVHKKCLYALVTTVDGLRYEVQRSKVKDKGHQHGCKNLVDIFGMTPFHVLLSSGTPRLDLLEILLEEYPPDVLGIKDGRGNRAMDYLISSYTTESKTLMKMAIEAWTVKRSFMQFNEVARKDMSRRMDGVLAAWSSDEKDELLRDLCLTQEGYEKAETFSLLELWLWKMSLASFDSTEEQDHVGRTACRFRCGASFIVSVIIGFLGEDEEDSYSSCSSDSELGSYSFSDSELGSYSCSDSEMDEDSSNYESDCSPDYNRYWDPDEEQFVYDSDYAEFDRGDY